MRILIVSDLHYDLRQFDWLASNHTRYELVVIAGDLMELGSYVDADTQAAVVEQYFRRICRDVPMVVCSGNHDLVEELDGTRTNDWLGELAIPGLVVDHGVYEDERVRILSLPWWENESERDRVAAWLARQQSPGDGRPVIWVHHAPPRGSPTGWNGRRDVGDASLAGWIRSHHPDLVVTGHVHDAPYQPDGSWIDRIGDTVVTNGGRRIGGIPATVVADFDDGILRWCGLEGCEEEAFGTR